MAAHHELWIVARARMQFLEHELAEMRRTMPPRPKRPNLFVASALQRLSAVLLSLSRQLECYAERLLARSGPRGLDEMLGTGMTRFAITIYAWQVTGEATALALVGFFAFGPTVLLSPVAGAIVDRANRRLVMMLSDLAAGLMTLTILGLYLSGELQIWHLYVTGALSGAFESFQFPAYSAAVTTMLPKEQYARANGMISLVESASGVVSPILAGVLIGALGIGGILTIAVITFCVALLALLVVFIPQPERSEAGRQGQGGLWSESGYGFKYILQRPSLFGVQLVFFGINFTSTFTWVLMAPLVLARSGDQKV